MIKLSVYLITFNEEKRLPGTLAAAVKVADELIIVDSGSTDSTESIALKFNAKFFHHDWTSYGEQVKIAQDLCTNRWVLRLDADEVLSDELIEEILRIKSSSPDCDGFRLRIGDVYPGIQKPIRAVKHYRLIRFYRRDRFTMAGVLDDNVRALVQNPKVKTLHGFVIHHSFFSLAQTIEKQNFATDLRIKMLLKEERSYPAWRMVGCSTLTFLKYYILYRQFLYGWWGFINSVNIAYFRFMKFAKWYEYEINKKLL